VDYYAAVQAQPAALERSARTVRAGLADIDLSPWRGGVFAAVAMGAGAAPADGYLFLSEGGRSRETIEAAGLCPPGARLGLTNAPDGPLSATVDALLS